MENICILGQWWSEVCRPCSCAAALSAIDGRFEEIEINKLEKGVEWITETKFIIKINTGTGWWDLSDEYIWNLKGILSQYCARLDEPIPEKYFMEISIVIQSRYNYY